MMRRIFLIGVYLCACITLIGCSDTEEKRTVVEKKDENVKEIDADSEINNDFTNNHLSVELCENVTIDADVIVPDDFSGIVNKYKAYAEPFAKNDVFKLFGLSHNEVQEVTDNLYRYEDVFFEFSNEISGALIISTEKSDYYYEYNMDYSNECSNIKNFAEDEELGFQKSEIVKGNVINLLEKIGVRGAVVRHVYALPIEYHQKHEKLYIENGMLVESELPEERWNDLSDCYEIILTTEVDCIPIYEETYVAEDDSAYNGGKIKILYSENGIQYLNAPNQYRINEQDYETIQILGQEELLDIIKSKMNSIILTETYTVTEMELCYLPQIVNKQEGAFLMQPIWKITIVGENDVVANYLFKADSGEEIQW